MSVDKKASIIVKYCSRIDDVNFNGTTSDSLIRKLAQELKLKFTEKFYQATKYAWITNNSGLRTAVELLLINREKFFSIPVCIRGGGAKPSAGFKKKCLSSPKKQKVARKNKKNVDKTLELTKSSKSALESTVSSRHTLPIKSDHETSNNESKSAIERSSKETCSLLEDEIRTDCFLGIPEIELGDLVEIEGEKFRVKKIVGDGNCLFRSLSFHLEGHQNKHQYYRKEIVKHITNKSNWDYHQDYLSSLQRIDIRKASDYADFMGADGEFGTDYELGVFYQLHSDVIVNVYRKQIKKYVKLQTMQDRTVHARSTMHILFSGREDAGHWEILIPQPDSIEINLEKTETKVQSNEEELLQNINAESDHFENDSLLNFDHFISDESIENTNDIGSSYYDSKGHALSNALCTDNLSNKSVDEKYSVNGDDRVEGCIENICTSEKLDSKCDNISLRKKRLCKKRKKKVIFTQCNSDIDSILENKRRKRSNKGRKVMKNQTQIDTSPPVGLENDTVLSDHDNTSSIKKDKIFSTDLGTLQYPSLYIRNSGGYRNRARVRNFISSIFRQHTRCTCHLRFYGSMRFNQRDIVCYAKCRKADHDQRFRFVLDHCDEDVAFIHISSTDSIKYIHDNSYPVEFLPLRGEERKESIQSVKAQSVVEYISEKAADIDTALWFDGHPQELRPAPILYKAVSEEKCKDRACLQSADVSDIMQSWIFDQKQKDPFIRYSSLPLTVHMYKEADTRLLMQERPLILHFDATGSIARAPQDVECKRIFYYTAVAKLDSGLIKAFQMITSEHCIPSISHLLANYKYFAMKLHKKWPFVDAVVVDQSWALIHSILHEWNDMNIQRYLRLMYKHCVTGCGLPKSLIVIKICFSHFKKTISSTIDKKFPKLKPDKALIQECMSLLCLSRTLKQMDELFLHFCTIFLYKDQSRAQESISALVDKLCCF